MKLFSNLKKVEMSEGKFVEISNLSKSINSLPEYGVVFGNGLIVKCEFGHHSYAYAIGAQLTALENYNIDYEIRGETVSTSKFIQMIELAINSDGVIPRKEASLLFSLYRVSLVDMYIKDAFPDLYKLVSDALFINSKTPSHGKVEIVEEWSKKWLQNNGDKIWAVRVMSYMFDDDFWEENEHSFWKKVLKEKAKVTLPSKSEFKREYYKSPYGRRYGQAQLISKTLKINDLNDDLLHNLNLARIVLIDDRAANFGSLWQESFFDTTLDDYIFKEEIPNEITSKVKLLENLDESSLFTLHDSYNDLSLTLTRKDILKFEYAVDKDEAYISFITPVNLQLRKLYDRGDLVENFSIDKYTSISV